MVPPVANDEEGADYFFTTTCMRTKRLSDAGDDLAYLYFYKDQPESSARLEGFATSDRKSQLAISPMHDPAAIGSPMTASFSNCPREVTNYRCSRADIRKPTSYWLVPDDCR
jgi:hypothetical protein